MLEQPTTHMVKGHIRIHVCLAWDKFQVVKDVRQTEKKQMGHRNRNLCDLEAWEPC